MEERAERGELRNLKVENNSNYSSFSFSFSSFEIFLSFSCFAEILIFRSLPLFFFFNIELRHGCFLLKQIVVFESERKANSQVLSLSLSLLGFAAFTCVRTINSHS